MGSVKTLFISLKISPQVLVLNSWAERAARGRVRGVFTSAGSCEGSLTVLQGEWGAVHRLALGRGSALGLGGRAGAVDVAAAEAGAQLQAPHVANHSRGIESLLQTQAGPVAQETSPFISSLFHAVFKLRLMTLTLHLLLAKFFRICRLTDSWMFLQRAVSPAILQDSRCILLDQTSRTGSRQPQQRPHHQSCTAVHLGNTPAVCTPLPHPGPSSLYLCRKLWATYLRQNDHLPGSQKAHYWLTKLFLLAASAADRSQGPLALLSSGSGLGRHPNC